MTIRVDTEIKRQIIAKPNKKLADMHDQLNLCRSMTDFCLESRDTRLHKESIHLLTEVPTHNSPIVLHGITLTELPKEVLVMRNDDKLEVSVVLSFVDDTARRVSISSAYEGFETRPTR